MTTANTIWRDYKTDGVPSSGDNNPSKGDIRTWGTQVEGMGRQFVVPEQFGAVGDGVADDTAAVNSALNQVVGGKSSVLIPRGKTYLVTPSLSTDFILKYTSGTDFQLVGSGTIKVAASAGNYQGIIGFDSTVNAEFVLIDGPIFDHNGQNNTLADIATYEAEGRYTFSTFGMTGGYTSVVARNTIVKNWDGVVSYYFPHHADNGHAEICNSQWLDARNANGEDMDQSCINCTCGSLAIVNNTFNGQSWALAPRTAIETHSSDALVRGNTVTQFQVGANITGIHQSDGTVFRPICSDNSFNVSRDGILIWSQSIAPSNATLGLSSARISGNLINMSVEDQLSTALPSAGYRGIAIFGGSAHIDFENVTIENNQIIYPVDTGGSPLLDGVGVSSNWGGIAAFLSTTTTAEARDFHIKGNTVVNCAAPGIFLDHAEYRGLHISGNTLIDCATTAQSTPAFSSKVPLYVTVELISDAVIEDNRIISTVATPIQTDLMFLRDRAVTETYWFRVSNNRFEWPDGATITAIGDYVGQQAGTLVAFEGRVPDGTVRLPINTVGVGYRVDVETDADRGPHTAFKDTGSASAWSRQKWGTAAPTTGAWRAGDIVWDITPSASGFIGWVCTTAGTPGTWKTFGAISA